MGKQSVIHQDEAIMVRLTGGARDVAKCRTWRRRFIRALCRDGNVTRACQTAGISVALAYKIRAGSSRFAEAWDLSVSLAMERVKEDLEAALWDRAINGVLVPVVHGGRVVCQYWKPCERSMLLWLKAHPLPLLQEAAAPLPAPEPPPDPIRARALVDPAVARALAELEASFATPKPPAETLSAPAGGPRSG